MTEPHPINRTLLVILDNQIARRRIALADLPESVFALEPGGGCNSIRSIGAHLMQLRRFVLLLLGEMSPEELEAGATADVTVESAAELQAALDAIDERVRAAIEHHDPEDWLAAPPAGLDTETLKARRPGMWPELPTIERVVKPLNDFVNHLGGIRAIRRIHGFPVETTQ